MTSPLNSPGVRLLDPTVIATQAGSLVNLLNQATGTIPAGVLCGGGDVFVISSNASPGTQTTRTAAQLFADDPTAVIGLGYTLSILNSGAGTLTLAGGTGVTISGTATAATNAGRIFNVAYGGTTAAPTVTITNLGPLIYT